MIGDLRWLARKSHADGRLTAFQLYTSPLAQRISHPNNHHFDL
jgi:hypothetical protein